MFKAALFFISALLCMACGGKPQSQTATRKKPAYLWLPVCHADSVDSYRNQARQGNGKAYLKLACCYHDGTGVQRDYLTMEAMVALATETTGITMKEFTVKLPEDDEYRLIYTGIEAALANDDKTAWLSHTALESMGCDAEAEIIRYLRADTTTNRLAAFRHFYKMASTKDCPLKQVLACLAAIDVGDYAFAILRLPRLAEVSPALWVSLGHLYNRYGAIHNDSLAAHYYAKADRLALLSPMERRWLANYRHQQKKKNNGRQ